MSDLLPVEQALQQILAQAQAISDFETVAISEALGRITFEDCLSTIDVPPADNSAMDGYAINVADCLANDSRLPLSQTINAGHTPLALEKNTCARIFTGADIPTGADSVIMQEHCTHEGEWVQFPSSLKANNNIRQQAQDIAQGQTVVTKGTALKPQHIGLLASIGLAEVKVFRRLTVAILSTGDELVEPGQPLSASKIYNSNRPMLAAFLQQMSCNVLDLRTVEDTLEATIALLKQAGEADCIISTGGVSVGNEDHIKPAVEALGELNLWRIAMKPGKPLAFAQLTTIAEKPIPFFWPARQPRFHLHYFFTLCPAVFKKIIRPSFKRVAYNNIPRKL